MSLKGLPFERQIKMIGKRIEKRDERQERRVEKEERKNLSARISCSRSRATSICVSLNTNNVAYRQQKKNVTDKTRAKKAAQKKMKQTPKQKIRIKTNEIR
jgi:hypothetical protein